MIQQDAEIDDAFQQLKKSLSCSICLDIIQKPVSLPCSHTFCGECIQHALKQKEVCPMCSLKVRKNQLASIKKMEEVLLLFRTFLSSYENRKREFEKIAKEKEEQAKAAEVMASLKALPVSPLPASTLPFKTPATGKTDVSCSSSSSVPSTSNTRPNGLKRILKVSSSGNSSSKTSVPAEEKIIVPIQPIVIQRKAKYEVGMMVNVLPRTWSGINKLGGAGRVELITEKDHEFFYRVKYILDNHKDDNIPEEFLTDFEDLDRTSRRGKRSLDQSIFTSPSENSSKSRRLLDNASPLPPPTMADDGLEVSEKSTNRRISFGMTGNSSSSSSNGRSDGQKFRVLLTCIEDKSETEKKLEKMIQLFQNKGFDIEIAHQFTKDVTHVVVSTDDNGLVKQRTMKYMQGIAYGLWIVSSDWITDSTKAQQIQNEQKYEVKYSAKASMDLAPKRSRVIGETGKRLFHDMVFLLYGSFALPMPARSDISDLLQVCQGVVYTSVEEFQNNFLKVIHEGRSVRKVVVICGMINEDLKKSKLPAPEAISKEVSSGYTSRAILDKMSIVTTYWVLDSITNYTVQPYEKYSVDY